jgi:hypothetical protein
VVVARVVAGPVVGAPLRVPAVVAAMVAMPHPRVPRPAVVARVVVCGIVGSVLRDPDDQPAVVVARVVPGGIVSAVSCLGGGDRRKRERGRHCQAPESLAVSLGHGLSPCSRWTRFSAWRCLRLAFNWT